MLVGHSISVSLVLSLSGQVHRPELSHERDWGPQVLEDEQVEESRLVREPEGEKDVFAAQSEGEGRKHYDELDAHCAHPLNDVMVSNVAKLMVDHCQDLVFGVLSEQSVKENNLSSAAQPSDKGIRVA